MLCADCGKRNKCKSLCDDVRNLQKENKNYKTTYKNHEVTLSEYAIFKYSIDTSVSDEDRYTNRYSEYLPLINEIVENALTPKQFALFHLHFREAMPVSTIARSRNLSQQTVHQAIYGHPKNGGGIIRKIQKELRGSISAINDLGLATC